uniref:uncharacterized protein LOC122609937 n=1 Tax=Erigeron canadensis TaxID=72917 RepID=UPI001CB998D1|nr:uncharacterized protein LOC122609937 [Erigeron canadensis]XP_043638825.1 uncharacterized protein LOC122609937 [Erigeron canadensis]
MEFWQKARTFAEDAAKKSQQFTIEAAKKSQEFTIEAAKKSQEFTIGSSSRISDIVLEASKRSKEIAVEASKKADLIKTEAIKRADQIKSQIPLPSPAAAISQFVVPSDSAAAPAVDNGVDLERFGITDELREFVKEITIDTFRDFPLQDDTEVSDVPTVSNVRQDLTKFQEIHAKLVLSTVKEISKLRYELCPRVMRERKFWRIYFLLVNSHVIPYEKRYMEEEDNKGSDEKVKEEAATVGSSKAETVSKTETSGENQNTKSTTTKSVDQDLDVFLLGDLGDSDEGPDDGDDGLDDDDFDKL